MLRKKITFENFNGEQVTEEHCFHLSEADLVKTEIKTTAAGGFKNIIQRMLDAKDYKAMVDLIDELIIRSYGKVSDDGRRFMKGENNAYAKEFMETNAYTALILELLSGDEAKITEFIEGMLPQKILEEVKKEMNNENNASSLKVVDTTATPVN